jgi:monoamine oxidase
MISYTDGKDTEVWMNLAKGTEPSEETLGFLLTQECRKLFPNKHIPYPIFLKSHPWESGCTYWLPGLYDPQVKSKESLQPFGKEFSQIHVCGESFSLRQAWMEGALENTQALLRTL